MENDFISRKHLIDLAAKQNNLLDGGDVRSAPSVEAVEVVHGHWVRSDFFSDPIQTVEECSLCGDLIVRFSKQLNYCPNCGAKMEQTENE